MTVVTVFVQNDFIEGEEAIPFYTEKKMKYASGRAVKQTIKKSVKYAQKSRGWHANDLDIQVQIKK